MNKRRSNEFGRHEFMVNFLRLADLAVFGGFAMIGHSCVARSVCSHLRPAWIARVRRAPVSQLIADQVRSGQTTVSGVLQRPGDTAGSSRYVPLSTGPFESPASVFPSFPGAAAILHDGLAHKPPTDLRNGVRAKPSSGSQPARQLRAGPRSCSAFPPARSDGPRLPPASNVPARIGCSPRAQTALRRSSQFRRWLPETREPVPAQVPAP